MGLWMMRMIELKDGRVRSRRHECVLGWGRGQVLAVYFCVGRSLMF